MTVTPMKKLAVGWVIGICHHGDLTEGWGYWPVMKNAIAGQGEGHGSPCECTEFLEEDYVQWAFRKQLLHYFHW